MKKVKLILGLLLIFGIYSCSKNNVPLSTKVKILSKLEIQNIGIKHNEALGYVLEALKNSDISKSKSPINMEMFINSKLNEFYTSVFIDPMELKTAIMYSEKEGSKYIGSSNLENSFKNISRDLSPIESALNEYGQYLTSIQKDLLFQCNEAISGYSGGDPATILNKLETIQGLAQDQLSVEEAQVIIIGAEIGKMSVIYWNENIEEWIQILKNSQPNLKGWFSWGELAGADVAGGVGAAVTTAIVNAVPGAGQVAYGAAVVGGAAGASVGDAIFQIWNEIF